ncbi:MAG: SRPBCC domain-containing protein [Pseudomonadota bacterium]|nr:SRPBCC domain-containing protein [Pseudomonadota bacterium]
MSANPSLKAEIKPSLTLKRRLNAAPEKVYAAWTEPAQIAKWFGPDTGAVTRTETDVRVGGRYTIVFHTEDGGEHYVSGVYREVVRNQKLQFTWAWRSTPERESVVTILVKPEGNGSILTLIHEQFFDEPARDRHQSGWTGCLDKLERYLT